jgi:hypothetical protein
MRYDLCNTIIKDLRRAGVNDGLDPNKIHSIYIPGIWTVMFITDAMQTKEFIDDNSFPISTDWLTVF